MNSRLMWKMLLIMIVFVACLFGVVGLPHFPDSIARLKSNVNDRIHLGLDLKGGSHLVLQVQIEQAIAQNCDQSFDELKNGIRDKHITVGEIRRMDDTHILVRDVDPDGVSSLENLVATHFQDWALTPSAREPNDYEVAMKPSAIASFHQATMNRTLETVTRRINALGLAEPTIEFTGRSGDEILVELPGVADSRAAKRVINAGGQLQLVRVAGGPYASEADALVQHGGVLPPATVLLPGQNSSPESETNSGIYYLLDKTPIVTGQDLRNADASPNTERPGEYQVDFKLSTSAAAKFGGFTEQQAAIGGTMAVVLDGHVYEAARIENRIEDSGRIVGNFNEETASDLAVVLRSGALPASVKYVEEGTVGPSLGIDSIRAGVRASIVSLVVVMTFLVVYYRMSGVNAVVALIFNLVILIAFLAYTPGAVLTLPGIAGVILTIGMGVDSNVLVFERIREELRNGKAAAVAVDLGFDRALRTIIDTHVTTVVSAVFLFLFGTGPVRGFALTLTVGLIANAFTSIYVSRAIFDYHLSKMDRNARLSI
jgi:preprotein translocase subunit SecD